MQPQPATVTHLSSINKFQLVTIFSDIVVCDPQAVRLHSAANVLKELNDGAFLKLRTSNNNTAKETFRPRSDRRSLDIRRDLV